MPSVDESLFGESFVTDFTGSEDRVLFRQI
jgi:hypothetical protein